MNIKTSITKIIFTIVFIMSFCTSTEANYQVMINPNSVYISSMNVANIPFELETTLAKRLLDDASLVYTIDFTLWDKPWRLTKEVILQTDNLLS